MGTVTIYPAVCTVCKKGHNQWDVDSKGRCKDCRIAALEAENAALRELAEAVQHGSDSRPWCKDIAVDGTAVEWFDRRNKLLTPEGGSNGN